MIAPRPLVVTGADPAKFARAADAYAAANAKRQLTFHR